MRSVTRRYTLGPLYYLAAFLLAYASFGLCLALATYFAIPFASLRRGQAVAESR